MTADVKKRGLGRGLDALFRDVKSEEKNFETPTMQQAPAPKMKRADEIVTESALNAQSAVVVPAVVSAGNQKKIAVSKLIPGKFQPRTHFDDAALQNLADSIKAHGVLQPLLVRPLANGSFEIIAGERRWRASQIAKIHEVPVVIQDLTDKQALEIALIENLQREDLSAIEEAEGYQRLMDEFSHTQEMLSQQLGKSRSHVANTLRLLKLPQGVRQMVQKGSLSAGHARTLVGASNAESIAAIIIKRNLSVRQTEKLVQGGAAEGKTKIAKIKNYVRKDVDILALEQKVTSHLGLKVTVDTDEKNPGHGKMTVEFKSLDQLDDVLKRLLASSKKA